MAREYYFYYNKKPGTPHHMEERSIEVNLLEENRMSSDIHFHSFNVNYKMRPYIFDSVSNCNSPEKIFYGKMGFSGTERNPKDLKIDFGSFTWGTGEIPSIDRNILFEKPYTGVTKLKKHFELPYLENDIVRDMQKIKISDELVKKYKKDVSDIFFEQNVPTHQANPRNNKKIDMTDTEKEKYIYLINLKNPKTISNADRTSGEPGFDGNRKDTSEKIYNLIQNLKKNILYNDIEYSKEKRLIPDRSLDFNEILKKFNN